MCDLRMEKEKVERKVRVGIKEEKVRRDCEVKGREGK